MSKSFRAAVNAKCRDCIYDPAATGGWRQQVEACSVTTCGLYAVRPVSYSAGAVENRAGNGEFQRERRVSRGDAQGVAVNALRGSKVAMSVYVDDKDDAEREAA